MTCMGILAKDQESTFVSKVCMWTAPVRDRINLEVASVKEKDASDFHELLLCNSILQ